MIVLKSVNLTGYLYDGVKDLYVSVNVRKSDRYFNYKVKQNNIWNDFFIVLVDENLSNKVVGVSQIEKSKEEYDHYLINDLIIDSDYRNKGLGSLLVQNIVEILKEDGAVKICSFAEERNYSNRIFSKLGFVSNSEIHNFGDTVPGDDNALYYELNIKKEYRFEKIDDVNSRYLGKLMYHYAKDYEDKIPYLFFKGTFEWMLNFRNMNKYDNEIGYAIFLGCKCIGYLYLYTVDDEKYISVNFELDDKYICKSIFEQIEVKALEFYEMIKSNNDDLELFYLKALINDDNNVKKNHEKYIKYLTEIGFAFDNEFLSKKI